MSETVTIDVTSLSEEERKQIIKVLARNNSLKRKDNIRIQRLHDHGVTDIIRHGCGHTRGGGKSTKHFVCALCKESVCQNCVRFVEKGKINLCSPCYDDIVYEAKTGGWFHKTLKYRLEQAGQRNVATQNGDSLHFFMQRLGDLLGASADEIKLPPPTSVSLYRFNDDGRYGGTLPNPVRQGPSKTQSSDGLYTSRISGSTSNTTLGGVSIDSKDHKTSFNDISPPEITRPSKYEKHSDVSSFDVEHSGSNRHHYVDSGDSELAPAKHGFNYQSKNAHPLNVNVGEDDSSHKKELRGNGNDLSTSAFKEDTAEMLSPRRHGDLNANATSGGGGREIVIRSRQPQENTPTSQFSTRISSSLYNKTEHRSKSKSSSNDSLDSKLVKEIALLLYQLDEMKKTDDIAPRMSTAAFSAPGVTEVEDSIRVKSDKFTKVHLVSSSKKPTCSASDFAKLLANIEPPKETNKLLSKVSRNVHADAQVKDVSGEPHIVAKPKASVQKAFRTSNRFETSDLSKPNKAPITQTPKYSNFNFSTSAIRQRNDSSPVVSPNPIAVCPPRVNSPGFKSSSSPTSSGSSSVVRILPTQSINVDKQKTRIGSNDSSTVRRSEADVFECEEDLIEF